MLRSLQIKNFAIIEEIDITFSDGMTVLTGETGAGKSILIDALSLVLGERGSASIIRDNAKRAEYTAEFEVEKNPRALEWLKEKSLDNDEECILRRVITDDGKSKAFINDSTVNLRSLKSLGELLVDIHGQHFHQSMCKKNIQRDMLDHFGDLKDLTNETKKAYVNYKEQSEKLNRIIESNANKVDRIDLLEFQEKELESLNLSHNKYNDLNKEFKKISNTEEISKGVNTLIGNLQTNEITNAGLIISDSIKNLNSLINFDDKFKEVKEMMIDAEINISEAVDVLSKYISSIDFDRDRSSFLEEKINAIHAISRKHKVEPNNLIQTHEEIKNELDYLRDSEASIIKIEEKINEYKKLYDERAKELTNARIKASKKLSKLVSEAMAELGMTGGVFDIEIKSIEGHSKHGNEEINFLISANPGQKPKPLTKIASGGELSRMSLAIQVIASNGSNIPTMIFDEVDSGIGGAIAEMVGIRLSDLSNHRQILCVTHLAQVASKGDSHIRINKLSDQNTTKIHATKLNEDSRIEEIARMLGGIKLTDKTRDHAIEMLSKKN